MKKEKYPVYRLILFILFLLLALGVALLTLGLLTGDGGPFAGLPVQSV
ncbi:MAG: hypothetical protein IJP78_00465 [Clostridia bacterium]|nr:hypothetical protein [Clostridia bacterium]